jgi:hypothetical protein
LLPGGSTPRPIARVQACRSENCPVFARTFLHTKYVIIVKVEPRNRYLEVFHVVYRFFQEAQYISSGVFRSLRSPKESTQNFKDNLFLSFHVVRAAVTRSARAGSLRLDDNFDPDVAFSIMSFWLNAAYKDVKKELGEVDSDDEVLVIIFETESINSFH